MVDFLEDSVEKRAAKDLGDPEPEDEVDPDIETESVEEAAKEAKDILTNTPDWLAPEHTSTAEQPVSDRPEFDIDVPSMPDINVPDIQMPDLENLEDIPFEELSDLQLLGIIAQMSKVTSQLQVTQLKTLIDIANAVEPNTNITVSGTNTIDDANTTQPVVPESDNQNIPTRKLIMKASTDNNKKIYIGDDDVKPDSGFVLDAGDTREISTDLRGEELYMASEEAGQEIQLMGVF